MPITRPFVAPIVRSIPGRDPDLDLMSMSSSPGIAAVATGNLVWFYREALARCTAIRERNLYDLYKARGRMVFHHPIQRDVSVLSSPR